MPVKAIPEHSTGATPYLRIKGGVAALDYYRQAFGAVESFRLPMPDGSLGHAEIAIGAARVMLSDEFPAMNIYGPKHWGGTSVAIQIYVADVDAFVAQAAAIGGTIMRPPTNEFYGDRAAIFEDPFGHVWFFNTHVEDVSHADMQSRMAAMGEPA